MASDDDFDALLSGIGFGGWQMPGIFATMIVGSQLAVHLVGSPLAGGPRAFRCFTADGAATPASADSSTDYYNNECFGDGDSAGVASLPPLPPTNASRHETNMSTCPLIEYDSSVFTDTVISDWHLVCERESLQPLYQMVFSIGTVIGSFVGGYIGDKWGRRLALRVFVLFQVATIVLMYFTTSFEFLLALRVAVGFFSQGLLIPVWSYVLESTPTKYRSLVGMLLGMPYSVSVVAFSGIGYFFRSWRYLNLVSCSPILLLLPIVMTMPESARWLVQQGRLEEATKVLRKAVKANRSKLTTPLDVAMAQLQAQAKAKEDDAEREGKGKGKGEGEGEEAKSSMWEGLRLLWAYLRSPAMRLILLVTPLLWFLQSCLYLAVAINANNFSSEDPHLYVCLSGVMDFSAILLTVPLTSHLGRRVIVGIGMLLGGLLFLLDLAIPEEYYWPKLVLVMAGFLLVAGTFQMNYVYAPELFPTEARTRGFAFVNVCGALGFMVAPFITYRLALLTKWAVPVTFGLGAIVGGFTLPLLPETRNTPMPDTLRDVELRYEAKKKNKKRNKMGNGRVNPAYDVNSDTAV